jgi:hypothetical protein
MGDAALHLAFLSSLGKNEFFSILLNPGSGQARRSAGAARADAVRRRPSDAAE